MKVLEIISAIWKSGANIYLDESDGRIAIKRQNLIPAEVMQAAEQNYQAIDDWFQSWKDASAEKLTIMKILHQFCGWQQNQKLYDWLLADEESLQMFYDWTIVLAKNGWKDMYEDYRQFENDESNTMARKIYERAVTYARRGVGE
ncbi:MULTISPECIES: hypothetical protein [Bacillus cereus group]|uniref:hypothetical protein n=1 Tax=Bacillus cereus group TaxID=86661 RepID=UPI000BEE6978|nr:MULTISPECIES: hypothetical protein [Bacillus cereus group]PEE38018.1 hypothetical protein CON59_06420 [Bacillus cereus]PEK00450.1 hypothetical protein CN688_00120 [Bacillus toyonensis]PEK75600.1 hypothetical protein CN594_30180 [Bacillus toyonensis]PEO48398.1 hypothetical protein CN579_29795 [Bacillus toyonensis]PFA57047.1 hypothetical protein CN389_10480 [Bacillus cereus]